MLFRSHALDDVGAARPFSAAAPGPVAAPAMLRATASPAVTTGSAYAAGNVVGGLLVFAGLTLGATPRTYATGDSTKITFVVTDAGVAVPGAQVRADGRSCTTNASGKCTLTITAGDKQRSITAVATKSGFTRDGLTLKGKRP